VIIVKKE